MRSFLATIFGASMLAIVGCQDASAPTGGPAGGDTITLSGAVVDARNLGLFVESETLDDLGCPPSDLVGQQLTIRDGANNTLGVVTLDKSEKIHASDPPRADERGYRILCAYPYQTEVVAADFYTLSLPDGTSVTYPKSEVIDGPASLLVQP